MDGNKYIDLICGWGPMILGYNNTVIDKAARDQYDSGNTVSVASPVMLDLAETLVSTIDIADWALFGKMVDGTNFMVRFLEKRQINQKF